VITQNAWPRCTREDCETLLVPGTEDNEVRVELRAGDVATILTAWAAWFHRDVRPINGEPTRDWWGWCATDEVTTSNHLSATAMDLCSHQLPWNKRTMPAEEVDRTHAGLALFEGTVFWGRWWERPDEKHFEIWLPPTSSKVAQFAARLRVGYLRIFEATTAPASSAGWVRC
jgi:D-alanyl-D-alanine carboxypeptidase